MPRLSNAQQNQAIGLRNGGANATVVAARLNSNRSTISRLRMHYLQTGDVTDQSRRGQHV